MLHIQKKKHLGLMVLSSLIFNPKLCGGPSIWRFLPILVSTLPVVSDKKIKMWKSMDNNRLWRCLSPLRLRVWTSLRWGVLDTILCDKVCLWLSPVSSTNKTDCHNITEILLKVVLNTINLAPTVFMFIKHTHVLLQNYTTNFYHMNIAHATINNI
jgi:hypothetical protein